ncbi:glioma pathogenesis-related protein 1 isoform X2 [Artibeus jamaicensis]|uniref:glioma pathogenesis-related protein 1 isoform X2 n=1 Tax=Artibeus jamaicensis TaxID=9417 RepID=UPI00235A8D36|nr:glioma pathogenesis-related protein 1 isoform X2 [Artibeus jamaicensis]
MRVTLALTAWVASVVSSYSYSTNSLPDIDNEAFIKDCVHMHNKFRSEVKPRASDMLYMTWDPELARIAKAWARNSVTSWYNEVQYYDFTTRKCRKVCGHYTQVVWADSYKVGCAVQYCPKVSGFEGFSSVAHFICNYGPGGNYPTWPYKKGSTCSACPQNDQCVDNMCINPQRDKVTRYYSTVYPDWPIYSRNRYLSLFLIVSPPILILSAIITILVKHK